jgi:arsenate reductase
MTDLNSTMPGNSMMKLGFICVQNAGRSQMSAAFAERERRHREIEESVDIITGGTAPADSVHEEVVTVMNEVDIDLSGHKPREVSSTELESCDIVATMGCSTLDIDADEADIRDWSLDDPHNKNIEHVRAIRDDIENRVATLFDQVETQITQ